MPSARREPRLQNDAVRTHLSGHLTLCPEDRALVLCTHVSNGANGGHPAEERVETDKAGMSDWSKHQVFLE
jgi:hypothetical protein